MTEENFILKSFNDDQHSGSFKWESPSNIALVKYWGKKENQLPANPSISFTLKNCKTITALSYKPKENHSEFDFEVYLDGQKEEGFKPKIQTFFERIHKYQPFLSQYTFKIETTNTFPHSSGIASSASGMSALSLCLMSLEEMLTDKLQERFFMKKASFLARLGSGSAARSIEGPLMVWGKHPKISSSNDLFAIKYENAVHANFEDFQDTILLVDKGQKQVSSSVGHNLMHNHPFALQRFDQAISNLSKLHEALQIGDLEGFINIVESEALTLHAMMMTSMPYFILMKPNTLSIINKIWDYRKSTGSNVSFTLDAGANVHLLYPKSESALVLQFIKAELVEYCEKGQYIQDEIGNGAIQIP